MDHSGEKTGKEGKGSISSIKLRKEEKGVDDKNVKKTYCPRKRIKMQKSTYIIDIMLTF